MDLSNDDLDEFTRKSRDDYHSKKEKGEDRKKEALSFSMDQLLGKTFSSDEEVKVFIKKLEEVLQQNFFKRDEKSKKDLVDAKRIGGNTQISSRFIRYLCIHGPTRTSISTGMRKTYTIRSNCPAELVFKLSKDGKYYFIDKTVEHEGHEILASCRNLLSQNRKLSDDQKNIVKESIAMKGNKLTLMSQLMASGSKPIFRDISNIQHKLKEQGSKNSFTESLSILEDNNASYEVKYDSDGSFEGLFFFTQDMKSTFEAWPEFVLIDSTYKLLQLEYPIVIIAIIDGNGCTEVTGIAILVHETENSFRWLIEQLKLHNLSACENVKSFMADKDMVARKSIKDVIGCPVYICSFHVQQIFRRKITTENMDVTKEVREKCLSYFQRLLYARSEDAYMEIYNEFYEDAPSNVVDYFNQNWHEIREEWVKCYLCHGNFNNYTNNRMESFNQKIKLFIEKSSFLTDFLVQLFQFLQLHRNERDSKALNVVSKRPVFLLSLDEDKYFEYLTTFAFNYVSEQLKKIESVKYLCKVDNGTYTVKSAASEKVKYIVTPNSCTCIDAKSMALPCRHLFKIRNVEEMPFYDEQLCHKRWTKNYFQKHHRIFHVQKKENVAPANKENNLVERNCSTGNIRSNVKKVHKLKLSLKTKNDNVDVNVSLENSNNACVDLVTLRPTETDPTNCVQSKDDHVIRSEKKLLTLKF